MALPMLFSPDAEVVLLLCGHFSGSKDAARPLSTSEYHLLAQWLDDQRLQFGDLLDAYNDFDTVDDLDLEWSRVSKLLERGPTLALAVERWFNQGFWIYTSADDGYPSRYVERLGTTAPPVLYGIGNPELVEASNRKLAIVGSRDVDEDGMEFTREIAAKAVAGDVMIVSGGARGVDMAAMSAALDAGGSSIGVLASNLNRAAVHSAFRGAIRDERLTLLSAYQPEAGFSVGTAMARNKLIYTLADWALVISSDEKGGTWTGAIENIKRGWVPLFVRAGDSVPNGNNQLVEKGGVALGAGTLSSAATLAATFDDLEGV